MPIYNQSTNSDDSQKYNIHQNTDLTSFLSWSNLTRPQP